MLFLQVFVRISIQFGGFSEQQIWAKKTVVFEENVYSLT